MLRPSNLLTAVLLSLGLGCLCAVAVVTYVAVWQVPPFRDARDLFVVQAERTTETPGPLVARAVGVLAGALPGITAVAYAEPMDPGSVWNVGGKAEMVSSQEVSSNFFSLVGAAAPGAGSLGPAGAVLEWRFAVRSFGSAEAAVGKFLVSDSGAGLPVPVVGVAARSFGAAAAYLGTLPDAWIVTRPSHLCSQCRATVFLRATYARSRVPLAAELQSRLDTSMASESGAAQARVIVTPISDFRAGTAKLRQVLPSLWALALVLVLLMLFGAASVQLARVAHRRREMAVRSVLGATSGRLAVQLAREYAGMALAVAAMGAGISAVLGQQLSRLALLPAGAGVEFEAARAGGNPWAATAICAAVLALLVTAVMACGLIAAAVRPAWDNPANALRQDSGQSRTTLRLVAAGACAATAGLVLAALMARSFWLLSRVPLGFQAENAIAVATTLPTPGPGGSVTVAAAYAHALERVENLPGVVAAGAGNQIPVGPDRASGLHLAGRTYWFARVTFIQGAYFRALGIPTLAGRVFGPQDRAGAPRAAVVNRAAAKLLFGSASPLGKHILLPPCTPQAGNPDPSGCAVVGVVGDFRSENLQESPDPQIFLSGVQSPIPDMVIVVRMNHSPTPRDSAAAWSVLRQSLAGPQRGAVLVSPPESFHEMVSADLRPARARYEIAVVLGAAALLTAVIGIAGLSLVWVYQERRHIGIRLALGATPSRVARQMRARLLGHTALGVGAGTGLALLLGEALAQLLYAVRPWDAISLAAAAGLALASTAAASVPATRRAAAVEPALVLQAP